MRMWFGYNLLIYFRHSFHFVNFIIFLPQKIFMKVYIQLVPFECNFSCIIWEYACAFDEIPILISSTCSKHYFGVKVGWVEGEGVCVCVWGGGGGAGQGLVRHQLHQSSIYIFLSSSDWIDNILNYSFYNWIQFIKEGRCWYPKSSTVITFVVWWRFSNCIYTGTAGFLDLTLTTWHNFYANVYYQHQIQK